MFATSFTVMQVKKTHTSPFKYSRLYISPNAATSKKKFLDFLNEATDFWGDGTYILKHPEGLFAKFDIANHKINLYRKSENTGREFLCWSHFN